MKSIILSLVVGLALQAQAGMVSYKAGDVSAEGYVAIPKNVKPGMPGVLIVHDWMGMSDFVKQKADELANMGYVAFAADMYGKGNLPKDQKEASTLAGKLKAGDRAQMRARITAAFNELKKVKDIDPKHLIVMGYCFGGTTALELGRSGADVAGVVSFHGGLENPTPGDAKNFKGRVLAMHGALDPYVKMDEVNAFLKEMNDAHVDYQFVVYANAVHAFAVPGAGNDPSKGAAYNMQADHRSWEEFRRFIAEVTTVR